MSLKIDQDHSRFRAIVRGKIRQNLRRYVSQGELMGKQGKEVVSIPIPHIDIPRFRFQDKEMGGVGQGEGDPGDPLSQPGQEGEGEGKKAGEGEGDHVLEVDVTWTSSPTSSVRSWSSRDIEDKGQEQPSSSSHDKLRRGSVGSGPESLRHFKRTYREALKRQIAHGHLQAIGQPRSSCRRPTTSASVPGRPTTEPVANAVIIYMMDVSGSMGDEQKEIVRIESFWIDAWLTKQYKGLESRFIIHDCGRARGRPRHVLQHARERRHDDQPAPTSSAAQMIETDYPPR